MLQEQALAEQQRAAAVSRRLAQTAPAAADPATAAVQGNSNPIERIKKLSELHASGALTDSEFADLKAAAIRDFGS